MARPDYFVTSMEVVGNYRLQLGFEDGTFGEVDLSYLRNRGGIFKPLADSAYFALVRLDLESGTIVWPNEVDIAPETLYTAAHGSASGSNFRVAS